MVTWSGRRNQRRRIITVNGTSDRHQDPRSLRVILVLIGIEYYLWALGPIRPANQQAKPHWLEPNPNDACICSQSVPGTARLSVCLEFGEGLDETGIKSTSWEKEVLRDR